MLCHPEDYNLIQRENLIGRWSSKERASLILYGIDRKLAMTEGGHCKRKTSAMRNTKRRY